MIKCPYCGMPMEEGFLTLTTNSLADISWSAKPSILALRSEKLTGWSVLAKNLEGSRCRACRAVSFRY